jgi:PAS domain S-box-containing protein
MSDNLLTNVMAFVNATFSADGLKAVPFLLSLFSAWVVVLVLACLNLHSRQPHFRLWAVAWLCYSMAVAAAIGLELYPDMSVLVIIGRVCIGVSALWMFLGNLQLRGRALRSLEVGLAAAFLAAWSYIAEYTVHDRVWSTFATCLLLALASAHTAALYLKSSRQHKGAVLLAAGLLLWSVDVLTFPVDTSAWPGVETIRYLVSSLLALFIALAMVLLALEQSRERHDTVVGEFKKGMAQRRLLEQEINLSGQKYRLLFDSAGDAIFLIDLASLEVADANVAAGELMGCESDKLVGRSFLELCPKLHNRTTSLLENKKLVENLFDAAGEFQLVRRGGEEVLCDGSVALMDDQKRSLLQVNAREITGRKKMEQQLRQAEKLSALGQLVAGVAHELNNPLAVVMGYAQIMVRNPAFEEKSRKDLLKILHESERAAKIVRNLLTFARPREPHMAIVDVSRLVAETLDTLEIQVQGGNARLVRRLTPGLPPTKMDPGQIEQVLANLITNAIQAFDNQPGQRVIEVITEKHGDRLRITVGDNGPGIPMQLLDKIFDPFFTTKGPGRGTGLGLSICYSIMEEHKGKIWVESQVGKGARFIMELPVVSSLNPGEEKTVSADVREPDPHAPQRRLLIVDDEPGIVEVLKEVLTKRGHLVETASNGGEALSRIATQHYDLIISDLCMPEIGGEKLFAAIREKHPQMQDRIIFVTGDTVSRASRRFLDESGARWLSKPFNIAAIEQVVDLQLRVELVETIHTKDSRRPAPSVV